MLLLKATSLGVAVAMEADPPTVAVVTPLLEIKNPFHRALIEAGGVGMGLQVGPSPYVKLYWPSTVITGLTIPIIVNSLLLCKPTTTLILLSRIPKIHF
jgi:hypothetical protein